MAKKKDKKPKTTGFVKNLASSVKSAAKDSAKELMPNLSAAVKTNTSVIKNAYTDTQIKFSETDIKQSYLFKSGENLIKNAKADLKSGNIYNKKRMEENTDDPFAKLLNFNFDDPDNDTFNTADDKEPTPSLNLDADSKNDIKTMANFTVAQTKITNRGMAMMTTQLGSISKFHNKNTIKFYEMVEDRLGKIDQNLNIIGGYYKDLVENAKKSTGSESKKPSLNIAYEMGGFDLSEYFEVYKKNAEDLLGAGSMLGSMMIKPMITDFVNNPIGSLLKMGMKGAVPKGVRKSLQDIDRTIGALPILLQGKVPAMKQKGGIWGLLGEVLDLDKNRTKADKNKFVKGPISFDGVTKRAITHVIPGYLRRILVAITKNDKDDLVYDMDMGKFVQASDARKNFRNEIKEARRSAVDGNIDRLEEKYIKELKRRKIISSDEEGSKYLEELRESLSTLGSKGKTLASDFNASDLSKNKKTAKILTEIISNLDSAEFQETNQAMVDAYLNYDNKLKELKDKEIWSSVNDKGGYKSPKKKKDDSIMGRFDNLTEAIEDIGEKGKKNFINKIKNKNLREGLGWIVDDDEHGRNKTINKVNERVLNAFRGDIEDDTASMKNKKKLINTQLLHFIQSNPDDPRVKNIVKRLNSGEDPTKLTGVMNSVINTGRKAFGIANDGLYQYMTMSKEGPAVRVKIVGGKVEVSRSEEEELSLAEMEMAMSILSGGIDEEPESEVIDIEPAENIEEQTDEQITDNGIVADNSATINMVGDLFESVTGQKFNGVKSIKDFAKGKVDDVLDNTPAGKFAKKQFNRFKESETYKTAKTKLFGDEENQGMFSGLIDSTKELRKGISKRTKGIKDYAKEKTGMVSEFLSKRTGLNKDKIGAAGLAGLTAIGNVAGDQIGNIGKLIGGDMSIKDFASSAYGGVSGLVKGGWGKIKEAPGMVKNIFKDGGVGELKNIFKKKEPETPEEAAAEAVEDLSETLTDTVGELTESISELADTMVDSTDKVAETAKESTKKATDKSEKIEDVIQENTDIVSETTRDISENIKDEIEENEAVEEITEAIQDATSEDNGGSTTGSIKDKLGEKFKNGKDKLKELFNGEGSMSDKFKGLKGKLSDKFGGKLSALKDSKLGGKVLNLGSKFGGKLGGIGTKVTGLLKGGGLAAKAGGIVSSLGGMASGAMAGIGSAASGLAAAAGPALAAALPVLGPIALAGAGIFAGAKLFKGIKNKLAERKARKEEEKAQKEAEEQREAEEQEQREAEEREAEEQQEQPMDPKKEEKARMQNLQQIQAEQAKHQEEEEESKAEVKSAEIDNNDENAQDGTPNDNAEAGEEVKEDDGTEEKPEGEQGETTGEVTSFGGKVKEVGGKIGKGLAKVAGATPMGMAMKAGLSIGKKIKNKITGEEGDNEASPKEKLKAAMDKLAEWSSGGPFNQTFGNKGLFPLLMKGATKAAGSRTRSSLIEFFKKVWEAQTTGSGGGATAGNGSGTVSTDKGGLNGGGISALSDKYSASKGDAGYISSEVDKPNDNEVIDPRYGVSNLSKEETTSFVESLKGTNADWYEKLSKHEVGSKEFNQAWKDIAKADGESFSLAQSTFGMDTKYMPLKKSMTDASILDFTKVGTGVESALYSLAMDEGATEALKTVQDAGLHSKMTDEEILKALYETRYKKALNSTESGKEDLLKRFNPDGGTEYKDALSILESDKSRQSSGGQYGYNGNYTGNLAPTTSTDNSGTGSIALQSSNEKINQMLKLGKEIIDKGTPYVYGTAGPNSFDCSGFTQYLYKSIGVDIPRSSGDQGKSGQEVPIAGSKHVDNAQPGDILWRNGHVMMYAGGDMVMHASSPSRGIRYEDVSKTSWFKDSSKRIRRYITATSEGEGIGCGGVTRTNLRTLDIENIANANLDSSVLSAIDAITLKTPSSNVRTSDKNRNIDRNNSILDIKEYVDLLCENTDDTNNLLMTLLEKIRSKKKR